MNVPEPGALGIRYTGNAEHFLDRMIKITEGGKNKAFCGNIDVTRLSWVCSTLLTRRMTVDWIMDISDTWMHYATFLPYHHQFWKITWAGEIRIL